MENWGSGARRTAIFSAESPIAPIFFRSCKGGFRQTGYFHYETLRAFHKFRRKDCFHAKGLQNDDAQAGKRLDG